MTKRMQELVKLVEIQDQRIRQSLQVIVAQEIRVRSELASLQQHKKAAQSRHLNDEPEMRSMGADILWEKWLEKSHQKLNLELAQILAAKEIHMDNARKSFGRLKAAKTKEEQLLNSAKKQSSQEDLNKTITQYTFKNQ